MTKVVIYDSGVGGLSIYQKVVNACPELEYTFVCDNAAFPYGTKDESRLIERIVQMVDGIQRQYAPHILVVACNTASTVALPILRQRFDFDIVGVVPAIKPAAKLSQTKVIGLLATPATIQRDYTRRLIRDFAADCDVIKVGSSQLVELAEHKLRGQSLALSDISAVLSPFLTSDEMDVLVLACTHFPLLNKEINQIFEVNSNSIELLDSGDAIARRVHDLALTHSVDTANTSNREPVMAFTQTADQPELLANLRSYGFNDIKTINV